MMKLLITGTGRFSSHLLQGLGQSCPRGTVVTVVGNKEEYISAFRSEYIAAGGADSQVVLETVCLDYFSAEALTPLMLRVCPDLVICTHSSFSPQEKLSSNRWGAFLRECAFGITLPLQMTGIYPLCRAMQMAGLEKKPLINACYPDLVNPLMTRLGFRITAGIGNIHTLVSMLGAQMGQEVLLAGHHYHLNIPPQGCPDVTGPEGNPLEESFYKKIQSIRGLSRADINRAGAVAGGQLLGNLLAGHRIRTSLPGPCGLIGGYPVEADGFSICLLGTSEEISKHHNLNTQLTLREGVTVSDKKIIFSGSTASHLNSIGVGETHIKFSDWLAFTGAFLRLKQELMSEKF